MKNFCSKFISIFAMSVFLSFAFVSCSDIDSNESATVSFSLSPDLAKAVLGAGRSAREATDDGTTGGDTVTPTENSDTDEDFGFYKIEVLLTGDQNEKQEQTYTSEEWKSIAKGSGVDSTFTFNDIRVGAEISVSATIYCGYGYEQVHELVWPCMTGSSEPVKIEVGENSVSCNVHRLARVNLYTYPDSGTIPEGDAGLDVYALPKDSEIANKILALVAEDDPKNDPEIYETLLSYPTVASYADSDSYLVFHTGGYELKDGAQVYMLSLLYTSDGAVYLGHPNVSSTSETLPEDAVTTIDINELNIIDLTLMKMDLAYTYIFPKNYADKSIAAWFTGKLVDKNANYGGTTPCIKTEYSASFLFEDGTFVVTNHNIKEDYGGSILKEKINYIMRGVYSYDGTDFENGTVTLTPTAYYEDGDDKDSIGIGWVDVPETESESVPFDLSNGEFSNEPFVGEGKATTLTKQTGSPRVYMGELYDGALTIPKLVIKFLFQESEDSENYVVLDAYPAIELTVKDDYESKITDYVGRAVTAGYMLNSSKSSSEPTLENGVYVMYEYFDYYSMPHHSPMDFEITLKHSSVPSSAELYQVTIFAVNESGYSKMSSISSSSSEQEKANVLIETLMDETVGKYLGSYTPKIKQWYDSDGTWLETPIEIDNPYMSVSSDGVTMTITDSYTAYGVLQANAPTGIVAIVQYGDSSTYSNFFVGLSGQITTSTSSTNSVSMALAERCVPVQVNFYAGENPLLLSYCVMVVDGTWSVNTNSLSNNFSNYMNDTYISSYMSAKGYSNPQLSEYTTTVTNGLPSFDVKVTVTPRLSYTGSCTNGESTYSITLSVYANSDSEGIYSVEATLADGSTLLVSCGTYSVSGTTVTVSETNYRSEFNSSAYLYASYDGKEQTFSTTDSSFTLSNGGGITFTFSGQ